jgi:hypothetical protein
VDYLGNGVQLGLKQRCIFQFFWKCKNYAKMERFSRNIAKFRFFRKNFCFRTIFAKISRNFPRTFAKTKKNPLNLAVIRHAWYMHACMLFFAMTSHFRKLKTHMWVYVRIQLSLRPKRKFHFRKIFAKISSRKLMLPAESLLM